MTRTIANATTVTRHVFQFKTSPSILALALLISDNR